MKTVRSAAAAKLRRLATSARTFAANEDGATAIEYGLIVSLIFLAIVGAVRGYVSATSDMYSNIADTLQKG